MAKVLASTSSDGKTLDFSEPQSIVTIIACSGEKEQKFVVYKQIIDKSDFFQKAFNSTMIEGQTQEMVLEDVDPKAFGIYLNWLHFGDLGIARKYRFPNSTQQQLQHRQRSIFGGINVLAIPLMELAQFYSLADRFLDSRLQKFLVEEMLNLDPSIDPNSGNTLRDFQDFAYSYDQSRYHQDLKKVAIQHTLSALVNYPDKASKLMEDIAPAMAPDFMVELAKKYAEASNAPSQRPVPDGPSQGAPGILPPSFAQGLAAGEPPSLFGLGPSAGQASSGLLGQAPFGPGSTTGQASSGLFGSALPFAIGRTTAGQASSRSFSPPMVAPGSTTGHASSGLFGPSSVAPTPAAGQPSSLFASTSTAQTSSSLFRPSANAPGLTSGQASQGLFTNYIHPISLHHGFGPQTNDSDED